MTYLYHAVPRNMTGTVLYPLNELREQNEALYPAHAHKYDGREHLMEKRIPILGNCLWNDVLFFTAVHPADFRKAFESAGFVREHPFRAFKIDMGMLDPSQTAVMIKMVMNQGGTYEPFDPDRMEEYAIIPQQTYDYWQEERALGNDRPLLYMHIPHILYRGKLDVSAVPIVEG